MTQSPYAPGQRWVSNTESELGLGIIVESNNRLVTVSFPAAGERRSYAANNAPLSRVQYATGESIRSTDGISLMVQSRIEHNHCLIYQCLDADGDEIIIPELELDSFTRFSKPQDRLFAGQIDKNASFQLRVETLAQRHTHQQSPVYGCLGPRVQLLPHQFYIVHQVAQRHAPRVLLADEVGLGKTIEAGLILHQQLISGRCNRALIIVPDSLMHQWLVEMLRRFNLPFTLLDEARCQSLENSGHSNPFESAQLVLSSLSFFLKHETRQKQAQAAEWDLLIVDEAHHLDWTETAVSAEYTCIEALAQVAQGLLLLTATPEQLGPDGHFARLRLLDPDRYPDLTQFRTEEASYQTIYTLIQALSSETPQTCLQDQTLCDALQHYLGETHYQTLTAALATADEARLEAIQKAKQTLLDQHGTGRVLFRNTRHVVQGFPERELHTHPLSPPPDYAGLPTETDWMTRLQPEQSLGSDWCLNDPRVSWLTQWLQTQPTHKVLVICARAETARALDKHLKLKTTLRSAVFHEGLSLVLRDRAAAYFSDEEDGAQVLVCSEIGSEGRNFQFAHRLILFDLPLNPDLLEQRIGRLDRIGQKHTIQIHVPYYRDSVQATLLHWYDEGLRAFSGVCAIGQTVYQKVAEPLQACLAQPEPQALDALIQLTCQYRDELLQTLESGRNRLLELSSFDAECAADCLEQVHAATRSLELETYMSRVLDHFGVEQQPHSASAVIIQPGDHMLHSFPGLPDDGLTATYRRSEALIREDFQFLSWEHPMVMRAMDLVLESELGNTAFCTLRLKPLKPGTLLLEAIFTLHCPAPRQLQLFRHLPQSYIRIVVDMSGKDLSHILTETHINRLAQRVPKHSAQELIRHARAQISELIESADRLASQQLDQLVSAARARAETFYTAELSRLNELAQFNPNVRADEIERLQEDAKSLQQHLCGTQLGLDALRVAVTTE